MTVENLEIGQKSNFYLNGPVPAGSSIQFAQDYCSIKAMRGALSGMNSVSAHR